VTFSEAQEKVLSLILKKRILYFQTAYMKVKKFIVTLCFILGITSFMQAQTSVDEMVKDWERAKTYTKEYLDAMPDSGYGLKPTPQMRSFAEQMLHITDANYGFTAAATGVKSPIDQGASEKTTDKSKANVTKLVLDGYDFVIANAKKMTPAQLSENIKLFGQFDMSKGMALIKCFEHQTHHRGQTTVYLRLAGVTPPQEKLF
jgi:uncharacterized damage-inducible protein DinB